MGFYKIQLYLTLDDQIKLEESHLIVFCKMELCCSDTTAKKMITV